MKRSLALLAVLTSIAPAFAQDEPQQAPPQPVVRSEPVKVTSPRMDTVIQQDVINALRANERLSGRLGVETYQNVVYLTGRVTTPGMVRTAVREARRIDGVQRVDYEIRTIVGGSY